MSEALDRAAREAGGRVIAALAARYRDLDLAEEAFADACLSAAEAWSDASPRDPAAWLYAVAIRRALDRLRRRRVRSERRPEAPEPEPTVEDAMASDAAIIPEERLRLMFVCCHPAIAPDARAALALKVVCGLPTGVLADASLLSEAAMAQRLVRAKRKIADAGMPFELPPRERWAERLDAVLSTLEVAYAQAYGDAAGAGAHAVFAEEVLRLSGLLARLVPDEPEALALAATVRFAEARRPGRLDADGAMIPLSEQDPALWRADLIDEGEALLKRAAGLGRPGPRALQAAIHAAHLERRRGRPTPWRAILGLYDALLGWRDDPVVRVNRLAALAEVSGPEVALAELARVPGPADWTPRRALHAHLLFETGRRAEAAALWRALAAEAAPAERCWLERRAAAASG